MTMMKCRMPYAAASMADVAGSAVRAQMEMEWIVVGDPGNARKVPGAAVRTPPELAVPLATSTGSASTKS